MKRKILLIEDNDNNTEVIVGFLKLGVNTEHEVLIAKNGKEGLDILNANKDLIDVILLDKMMPIMSGLEFLKKVKSTADFINIPIIMQTASSDKEDIVEGFKHGVYHYLIKPFSPVIFNSIVKSAIDFHSSNQKMQNFVKNSKTLYKYVDNANFKIKSIRDVNTISTSLASLFPHPDKVVLGISEILTNAIEHGNLQISYEEKTKLNLDNKWHEEIEERLNLPENKDKFVTINYLKNPQEITLHIKDEGEGFEFKRFLDFDANRAMDNHGRGIAFANNISFDKLEYLGKGNEVRCIVRLQ